MKVKELTQKLKNQFTRLELIRERGGNYYIPWTSCGKGDEWKELEVKSYSIVDTQSVSILLKDGLQVDGLASEKVLRIIFNKEEQNNVKTYVQLQAERWFTDNKIKFSFIDKFKDGFKYSITVKGKKFALELPFSVANVDSYLKACYECDLQAIKLAKKGGIKL